MTYRTFRMVQVGIGMGLGAVFGVCTALDNWTVPLIAVVTAVVLMVVLRRLVKEVIVDERTYTIAGNAARIALFAGTLIMGITGLVLFIIGRDTSGALGWSGLTLCYATCGLLILNALANMYYKEKYGGKE